MEYLVICLAALIASGLTLFSGFGLGTIMLPVFALFFPLELAIGLTAIVHVLNNLFKTGMLGAKANKEVVLKFGIPALVAAFAGAYLLEFISKIDPLYTYDFLGKTNTIDAMSLLIAVLIAFFALFDLIPKLANLEFDRKYLPFGGVLSGFFGGLSGHQGAMRSAFLLKAGLNKETFIATGIIISLLVDFARIPMYWSNLAQVDDLNWTLLAAATLCAFLGAYVGKKLMKKVTMRNVQLLVGIMLILMAIGMGSGILAK